MVKEELNQKSPLRKLEAITGGGVGKGHIGVIASKEGIGKTACLVHIAVDTLLRDKHVIHVSFDRKTSYISNWYEDIFNEISLKRDLENAMEVHDKMIENRIIMNFHNEYPIDKIIKSLEAMVTNGQNGTDLVIVDGFSFDEKIKSDLDKFKDFAINNGIELWFSHVIRGKDVNSKEILSSYEDTIRTILTLNYSGERLKLSISKHDAEVGSLDLCLDPKTLLIC